MGKKEENWGMGAAQIKLICRRNQHEITLSRRAEKLSSPYSSLQKRLFLRTQYLCAFLAMSPTLTVQSQRDTLGSSFLTFRDPAPIPPHLDINITWLPAVSPPSSMLLEHLASAFLSIQHTYMSWPLCRPGSFIKLNFSEDSHLCPRG